MAAKKKPTRRVRAREGPGPAQQPTRGGEQAEEVPAPPVEEVPAEGKPDPAGPPVAGLGASAGGLEAFKKFFAAMPPDSGIAFVLVPHLDPAHESFMVELLARHTTMPVVQAANDMPIEANHVYIIPPNKYMTIRGGVLRLTGPVERHAPQTSIDLFLRSLADDQQERSVCIILSGTGSHGSLGLKAVKAAGGMAMVQDPATAEYESMPQSAIATDLADYVLPVEQMPEALVKYVRHGYVNGGTRIEAAPEAADHLAQVAALLRARTGFDFRCYRKQMLARRVERRMGLNQLGSIPEYVTFLCGHPEELRQLVKDLFISVTNFFRDPEAFQQLASHVIAPLVRGKRDDDVIRVWVPGCATGEEPYAIAMLLLERLAAIHKSCRVQIFATGVDEEALEVARKGLYPESITADVSPERLARFFTRVDEQTYQVSKRVRQTVTFAVQNLVSDPPFTKLDLLSCRNFLIYLEPELQKKAVMLFHYALIEGGFLFLGSSETVGRHVDLFEPVSKKWRIYRRIGPTRTERVEFPLVATAAAPGARPHPAAARPTNYAEVTRRLLLERFAPAAVLIDRKCEILSYFGPCTNYLEFPPGKPTHDLMLLARDGLRARLREAVHQTTLANERVVLTDVRVRRNGNYYPVRLTVSPAQVPQAPEGLLLITFEGETSSSRALSQPTPAGSAGAGDEAALRQVEKELRATRDDLQTTIEELQSSNEELKVSNEEIMSMNEELQSTNEELETSKEELQSLNEELGSVNNQLQEKIEELEQANLLDCTDIATVFLDAGQRVKLFTPNSTRMFNLITTDIGRPISDIAPKFTDPDLRRDAEGVLHDLAPREKEVCVEDGHWYCRRIMPYRTRDARTDGLVITFVDITERKRAADAVVRRLAAVVESSADAIFSKDLDGTIRAWNRGAERLYGYTPDEIVGRPVNMVVPEDRTEELATIMSRLRRGESVEQLETERVRKDGQRVAVALTVSPVRDGDGKVVSASVISCDITDRKRAEETLRASEERFRHMADHAPVMIWMSGPDKLCTWFNKPWLDFVGRPLEQEVGNGWTDNIHPDDRTHCLQTYEAAFGARRPFSMEYRLRRHDGEYRWLLDNGIPLNGAGGEVAGYIGSCTDITALKNTEQALRDREALLRAILDTVADAIITIDHRGIIRSVNAATERMFGYSAAEMIGQSVNLLMPSPYREVHDSYLAAYLQTRKKHVIGVTREVEAQRKDGSVFPADLAVSEIEHLKLFTGVHRDLTERKRLEREVVEIVSQQQRRIGQDLHDSVAQELTALSIYARNLAETLRTDPASAEQLLERMEQGLQRSRQELRAVLRGLLPVPVDSEGLMAALADLADRTEQEGKVTCTFDCPEPVAVADNLTATQVYLIAQEAVHNAVRHAQAQKIRISLTAERGLVLGVQDDGIGMPTGLAENQGLGLRIMRNRAAIIGAALTIEPAEPTGTVVTCELARKNHAPEQA
jgi:two-component system CheB/CheR fusion protein